MTQVPIVSNLNEEQGQALNVPAGVSVALKSGAGCGKTTVLTSRFLQALERRQSLQTLVALTFTEKAAAELRGRIRVACRKRVEAGVDVSHWRAVLRGLEAARVGTFHSFCAEVLRQYPIESKVVPGFDILEESIAPTLRDETLNRQMREWLTEGNEDLICLAVEFGLNTVQDSLRNVMATRSLTDLESWAAWTAEQLVAHWIHIWQTETIPELLGRLVAEAGPVLKIINDNECSHKAGRERWARLRELVSRIPADPNPFALLADVRENAMVKGAGGKKDWPTPEIYEQVSRGLKAFRATIDKTLEALKVDPETTRLCAEQGLRFVRLADQIIKAYDKSKDHSELLDFDDLLLKTRGLLEHSDPEVLQSITQSIVSLLVDEFQDTDPIQGEILQHLTAPDPSSGRLFLVGDSKQSIYRFRGAQPRIFEEFEQGFAEPGRLSLVQNYRSEPPILHFVNAVFSGIYANPETDAIQPVSDWAARFQERPLVEFLWSGADEIEPAAANGATASKQRKAPVGDRRKTEACWIARLLATRLAGDWIIWDRVEEKYRPATANDVAILFRSLSDVAPYEQALAEEGLDFHLSGGSTFFGQQEVLDIINLLSTIEDPLDPLALAAALRSPFFCVSDDALYWLATDRPEGRGSGDLPRNFDRHTEIHRLNPNDRERVQTAWDALQRWRRNKDHEPIAALLDRALDESGYEAALLAEPLGPRKRANVRKLVHLARRYDRSGIALADFVARLRADFRRPPREDQAATTTEAGQAIRLMTIHQAKGLEFPIVVLPDLDRKAPPSPSSLLVDPDLGPLVPSAGDGGEKLDEPARGLGWSIFRDRERQADHAEALRLFYVATTRAISHLVLSAAINPDDDFSPTSPALKLLARRFDLANGQYLASLPTDWPIPKVRVLVDLPPEANREGRRRKRVSRFEIRDVIHQTELESDHVLESKVPSPSWIDLDPGQNLSPILTRIDCLIRSILAHPEALNPKALANLAAQLAYRQVPVAPRRVLAGAVDRLQHWISDRQAQAIARSPQVLRAVPWTLAWPVGQANAPVFRGVIDFTYLDRRGAWQLVQFCEQEAEPATERLRLLLSNQIATRLVEAPISRAWLVRLGANEFTHEEFSIDEEALREATTNVNHEIIRRSMSGR